MCRSPPKLSPWSCYIYLCLAIFGCSICRGSLVFDFVYICFVYTSKFFLQVQSHFCFANWFSKFVIFQAFCKIKICESLLLQLIVDIFSSIYSFALLLFVTCSAMFYCYRFMCHNLNLGIGLTPRRSNKMSSKDERNTRFHLESSCEKDQDMEWTRENRNTLLHKVETCKIKGEELSRFPSSTTKIGRP